MSEDYQLDAKDCATLLSQYRDPAEGDKLTAIQKDLDETMVIMHDTINAALSRGEKLEEMSCSASSTPQWCVAWMREIL